MFLLLFLYGCRGKAHLVLTCGEVSSGGDAGMVVVVVKVMMVVVIVVVVSRDGDDGAGGGAQLQMLLQLLPRVNNTALTDHSCSRTPTPVVP